MKRDQVSECGGCGSEERWLLHNVRHRGVNRRLCTSCVLKFHDGLFCPHCFEVYEGILPSHERVICLKCPSISHRACVGLDKATRYVCPSCLNPSFLFFEVGFSNKKGKSGDGESVADGGQRAVDHKSAKVLLAAAQIAFVSMSKAAAVAGVEAERRVKEAALTKKRAREALERVAFLVAKEKEKEKEKVKDLTAVPGSVSMLEQNKKFKGNSAVAAAIGTHRRIQNHIKAEVEDKSGGIPTPLINTGSRERETRAGLQSPNTVQGLQKNDISVDDKDKLKGCPAPIRRLQIQNPPAVNENDKSSNSAHLKNHVVKMEKESNGVFYVPPVPGQLQHPQNNHGMEVDRRNGTCFADFGMGPVCPNQMKLTSSSAAPITVLLYLRCEPPMVDCR